ncbi:MAG: hypothetical protein Q9182_004848 [Xanthomendoza sp. 2 TL-2023]
MALQRQLAFPQITHFPFGGRAILVPNEIIKTYLPRLWLEISRRPLSHGYLSLECLVAGYGEPSEIALSIILKALKNAETHNGVASELKRQLNKVLDRDARCAACPEEFMKRVFEMIAVLLRPEGRLGCHPEITYTLSEWFDLYSTENHLHGRTLVNYIIALDILRAEMTSPLLCLLRQVVITPASLRRLSERSILRRKTLSKLRSLWMNQRETDMRERQLALPPNHHRHHSDNNHLISGRYLDLDTVVERFLHDPDSIIMNLKADPRRWSRHMGVDDGLSSASDSSEDEDFIHYRPRWLGNHDISSYHPFAGHPPHACHPEAWLAQPRSPSPLLIGAGHPMPISRRPNFARVHSLPARHPW